VSEETAAIIELCQCIVAAEIEVSREFTYVNWHGFHRGETYSPALLAHARSDVSQGCGSESANMSAELNGADEEESTLQWWHSNCAKYAYRRSTPHLNERIRTRRLWHARPPEGCSTRLRRYLEITLR